MTRWLAFALMVAITGCAAEITPSVAEPTPTPASPPATPASSTVAERRAALPATLVLTYARRLAPLLVGRSLRETEATALTNGAALPALIDAWTREDGFVATAREWVSTRLKASGKRGDINLELPGNLAAYLARNRLPHSELLTATYCIDDAGQKTTCDSGAPFAAGVLTTRAFLSNNASRFNLKRARTVLRTFGCRDYPLQETDQPRLPREALIPLFAKDKVEGDTSGTFGNGFACYTCHSQFGAHAQPFVKFDDQGHWVASADGQQVPGGEQGRSANGLFASHLVQPAAARSEASQVFGKPVENLAGLAEAYVATPAFWTCSVGGLLGYVFGLADSAVFALPADVLDEVVTEAKAKAARPSLAQLAVEAFSHPAVVRSFEGTAP